MKVWQGAILSTVIGVGWVYATPHPAPAPPAPPTVTGTGQTWTLSPKPDVKYRPTHQPGSVPGDDIEGVSP